MAVDDLYVPNGVWLKCDKGAVPMQLTVVPHQCNVYRTPLATEADNIPLINIPAFGPCSITRSACIATAPKWLKVHEGALKVKGCAPLLHTSYCKCQTGGTIKIFFGKAEAEAALEQDKEDRVDGIPWLDKAIGYIVGGPTLAVVSSFQDDRQTFTTENIGRGFRKGLKGTVNGLKNMVCHPVETAKGLTKLVGVAIVGYGGASPIGIPPSVKLQQFDDFFGTELNKTHTAIVNAVSETWDQKVVNGTATEREELAGQTVEMIAEAVVGTKGAGAAIKATTTAGKLILGSERMAQVVAALSKLRFSNLAEKVAGIFKVGKNEAKFLSAIEEWLSKLEKRSVKMTKPPTRAEYQIKHCGNEETRVVGNGEKIWADGIDKKNGMIKDAKFVENPSNSPFVQDSKTPDFIRQKIRQDIEDEFYRYSEVIKDKKNPMKGLEIITNEPKAVPYFEGLMKEYNIPGKVTITP